MQVFKKIFQQDAMTKVLALVVVVLLAVVIAPQLKGSTNADNGNIHMLTCDAEGNIPLTSVKYFIGAEVKVTLNDSTASVYNGTNCNLPVSLASYEMYDRQLGTQKLFNATGVVNVGSGQSKTLSVSLPDCMAQIDLYYGEPLQQVDNANSGSYKTLAWDFYQNSGELINAEGPFCGQGHPGLLIGKSGPATTTRSGTLEYSLQVSSNGTSQANNVVLTDNYPTELTYQSSNGANCNNSGNVVTCNLGDLAAGQNRSILLTFKVADQATCGDITNQGTVSASNVQAQTAYAFTRINCPTIPDVVCSPANQNVMLDTNANFTATGGNGSFSWTASTANPTSGNGATFQTKYSSAGNKTVTVSSAGKTATCNVTVTDYPTLTCSPATQTKKINENATFTATGGTGSYAWVASTGTPSTGTGASLTTKYAEAGNKQVTVTSGNQTKNCAVVVEDYPTLVCAPASQTVKMDQNASFTATGGTGSYTWQANSGQPQSGNNNTFVTKFNTSGSKTITVTSGNQTKTCAVVVEDYPTLVCAPASQTVKMNQNASFVATGGTGSYTWQANGGEPQTGNSNTFVTKFNTSGSKTATVTSGNQTKTCNVVVEDYPAVACAPASQSVKLNQQASFVATGGNGSFAWTASQGAPTTGNGATFSASFNSTGSKQVVVTSNGKSATCNVTITEEPQNLVCAPANQTVDIDQLASFVASGGNGSYAWVSSQGTPATGTGSTYATRYSSSGSRTVTVTSGNKTANCNVVVRDVTLVCSPSLQYANTYQNVTLLATGGNGSYVWSAPEATTSNTNSSQISVSYPTTGTKNVTVYSAGKSDTCQVVVRETNNNTTLTISKQVRNLTQGGSLAENLSNVRTGDVLEYQVRIRNTGSYSATGVMLRDLVNTSGYLENFRSLTSSMLFTGTLQNGITFNYSLPAGQEIVVGYQYTAGSNIRDNLSVCNTASTWASNIGSVSDTACVSGQTGTQPSLALSKRAFNNTKNVDATSQPAEREDYITYTLTVTNNSGTQASNYVVTDDLSGVLPLADMVDLGGGQLSGNILSYPGMNIPAGSSISKTFKVRVKYHLSSSISYQMLNTYGNTVTVVINPPKPYIPPKTGGLVDLFGGLGFASILTAGFVIARKKQLLGLLSK